MDSNGVREAAIARVVGGEAVDDVALHYNIRPATLQRWVEGTQAGQATAGQATAGQATAGQATAGSAIGGCGALPMTGSEPPARGGARGHEVTILDVARRANLSKSVVSRALRGQYGVSPESRRRVAEAAEELGFVLNAAAQSLSAHRTNTIGVLVRDASSAFYGEMQSALQMRATQIDNRVFITSGALDNLDEIRALRDLIALRVDGLVVCSARLPAGEITRFSGRFPLVVAGRIEPSPDLNAVYGDEDQGARDLAAHLAGLGHRHVAVLQPPADLSPTLHRRALVMCDAVAAEGGVPLLVATGEAADAPAQLAELPERMTAVMCPNDRYAAELLRPVAARPGELALTGFDGVGGLAHDALGITTWRQPIAQIGVAAVDLLMTCVAHPDRPREHLAIPGTLRPSRSTLGQG